MNFGTTASPPSLARRPSQLGDPSHAAPRFGFATRLGSDLQGARIAFLLCQAFNVFIVWMFADTVRPVLLAASGVFSLCAYGWLLRAELVWTKTAISPFVLYLCTASLVLGASPIWAAFVYARGFFEVFMFGRYDATENVLHGHSILLLGDWLLIAGYTLADSRGRKVSPTLPSHVGTLSSYPAIAAILLLIMGWVFEAAVRGGLDPSNLGNWYKTFAKYSGPAGLLMLLFCRLRASGTERQVYLALIVGGFAIEIALAFRSYMKQEAIQVMLPVVILLASQLMTRREDGRMHPKWPLVLGGGAIAIFVVLILFPFSQMRRADSWFEKERLESPDALPYLAQALRGAVPGSATFAEIHRFPDAGLWAFLDRHGYLKSAGWSYQYVERYGHINGEFIWDGLTALVPRVVWPEKPMISAGRKVAVMLGQAADVESATTASDAGAMAGAMYLNWGMVCVVVAMFLNGVLLCLFWRFMASDVLINPFAALTAMLIYVNSARFFASATDANIGFYCTILILYLPLIHFTRGWFRASSAPSLKP